VGLLLPLSLLGALSRPVGWLSLVVVVLLVAAFLFDALLLLREGEDALRLERVLPPSLEQGVLDQVRLRVRNRKKRRVRLEIVDGCPAVLGPEEGPLRTRVEPSATTELAYSVSPQARGWYDFSATEIRWAGLLGLAQRRSHVMLSDGVRVHPDLRALRGGALRSRRQLLQRGGRRRTRTLGRDGDFERLRDFVSGDDLRHVDWKATARLRRPISRVYRSEKAQTLMLLVDASRGMSAQSAEGSKLDLAVEAALHLAWVGLNRGDRVGLTVFDDRIRCQVAARAGVAQFGRILDVLYSQQPKLSFPSYRRAARGVLMQQRRRSLVVWITDLIDGEQGQELLGALRAIRGRHLSLVVAQDDLDLHRMASSRPSNSSEYFERASASEVLDERETLLRALSKGGARVVTSGPKRISAAAVDEYLDVKLRGRL